MADFCESLVQRRFGEIVLAGKNIEDTNITGAMRGRSQVEGFIVFILSKLRERETIKRRLTFALSSNSYPLLSSSVPFISFIFLLFSLLLSLTSSLLFLFLRSVPLLSFLLLRLPFSLLFSCHLISHLISSPRPSSPHPPSVLSHPRPSHYQHQEW